MANRFVTVSADQNGNLQAFPDPLHVRYGDQVIWTNGMSGGYGMTGGYKVTEFSPVQPPLFASGSIDVPCDNMSDPVTVQANPVSGISMRYKYSCVSTGPDGKVLDPIIIVDPPGGDR
jgi:hypothetical protein